MENSADYDRIDVRPCDGALGTEIHGVNLAEALGDEVIEEIHRAWLEHQVVIFRDQQISPAQQVAFAARLGELDVYPFLAPLAEQPEIIPIIKEKDTRFNFGGGWHSDTPYQETPPKATMSYALDVPSSGGDTLFADMYAAYEALSPGMQEMIEGLQAVYTAAKVHGSGGYYKNADHPMAKQGTEERAQERYEHPIVRTHPETRRKALFVSLAHIERLSRMRAQESLPLLEYLAKFATRAEFTTRLRWRVGSLALWDNRCVQHYALNDYAGQRRAMHRLTLKGDKPF